MSWKFNPFTGSLDYFEPTTNVEVTVADSSSIDFSLSGQKISATVLPAGVDHNSLLNYSADHHFLQTAITNVSTALSTGLLKVTTGTGALTVVTDNSSDWNTAYGWGNHASSGYFVGTDSTIRALISSTATGLTYTNTTGFFSLTSGYVIPTTTEESNWNTAYGWGDHSEAGYVTGTPWTSEGYLTSLTGAVLTSQSTPQTIGDTDNRLLKLWATDITVTNAIAGSITGNAATVTNGVYTTGAGTVFIAPYGSTTAKYFLAAPNDGNGVPSFRAILASDIPALSYAAPLGEDDNYVTDAEKTILSNTSGTNSGDQSASDFDIKYLTDSTSLRSTWSGKQDALNGTGFVKISGTTISYDNSTYLTSLSGAVLTSQATPQTIGDTDNRLTKLWATDITVTNAISGSITGNAATVTNGVYTTDAGTVFLAPDGDGASLSNVVHSEIDPVVGAINGIVKANGAGTISAAVADSDYLTPGTAASTYAALSHASRHAVGGADTIFPADPGADKFLMWDDVPGELVWADAGGTITGSGTTNEIPYWVNSTTLGSLAVATYPSLTELSYVKGVTSAIQTQLSAKLSLSGGTMTGALVAEDHGTASSPQVVNVCYGTGNPPAIGTVPEGTIYIKYVA